MRLIDLDRVLGFLSSDAEEYQLCSTCHKSWYRWDGHNCVCPEDYREWRIGIYVADTVDCKSTDSQFPALVDNMRLHGMRTPVRVGGGRFRSPTVFNGHHRIAAALLLGWSRILISSDRNEVYESTRRTEDVTGWREGDRRLGY